MIKVMRVIPNLGMGGAEKRMAALLSVMDKNKFCFSVCALQDKNKDFLVRQLSNAGVKFFNAGMRSALDLGAVFRVADIIKSENIDILHTHMFPGNTAGKLAGIIAGVPVIVGNEHNVDDWKHPWHFMVDRLLLKKTDKVIMVSEKVREFYIAKAGYKREKTVVIYNGVEDIPETSAETRREIREKYGFKEEDLVCVTAARYIPQKGIELILSAAESLRDIRGIKFILLGEGPLRDKYLEFIREKNLEDKITVEDVKPDIYSYISSGDVVLLTSYREGFSNFIIEAGALGKPVIATDVGGNGEAVEDGVSGFIIKPGDASMLREKILYFWNNRSRAAEFGAAGRDTVRRKFTIRKMAEETEKLYLALAEKINKRGGAD